MTVMTIGDLMFSSEKQSIFMICFSSISFLGSAFNKA